MKRRGLEAALIIELINPLSCRYMYQVHVRTQVRTVILQSTVTFFWVRGEGRVSSAEELLSGVNLYQSKYESQKALTGGNSTTTSQGEPFMLIKLHARKIITRITERRHHGAL